MNQKESRPIMFGVASCAGLGGDVLLNHARVIATSSSDASGDFRMAIEALESSSASRLMTLRTIRGAFKAGVSA